MPVSCATSCREILRRSLTRFSASKTANRLFITSIILTPLSKSRMTYLTACHSRFTLVNLNYIYYFSTKSSDLRVTSPNLFYKEKMVMSTKSNPHKFEGQPASTFHYDETMKQLAREGHK